MSRDQAVPTRAVPTGGVWMNDNGRLPKRADSDLYVTPRENVEIALDFLVERVSALLHRNNWRILDLGAGPGVWGQAVRVRWPNAFIHGVELRDIPNPGSYDLWSRIDMRSWAAVYACPTFDLVLGNPPYSLDEEAVRIGLDRVCSGGHVMMLLPITFLTSQSRRDGLYAEYPLRYYAQFSQRISWNGSGKTPPRDHALYVWQKGVRQPFEGYFLPNAHLGNPVEKEDRTRFTRRRDLP